MSFDISASYAYNPNGKLSAMTVASASTPRFNKLFSYDTENRLTQIAVTNAANQQLLSFAYTYNRAQQITQILDAALLDSTLRCATNAFVYDARDQLTNELHASTHPPIHSSTAFSYDHAQNREWSIVKRDAAAVSTAAYAYMTANRLESIDSDGDTTDDGDGLPAADEVLHGSDPLVPDTDADGFNDGDEVNLHNTSPWSADSDGDNLPDGRDPHPLRPDGGVWFGATDVPPAKHWWLGSASKPVQSMPLNNADHRYYYDIAGNLVSSVVNGVTTRFYYNAQNKLSKITSSGFTYEFMYDSRNRRVGVKKNNGDWRWDIHDGNVCIAQVENGIMKKFFVRGMGIAEGTGDVVAEVDGDDLQFTNYNVQFGAEGRQDAGFRMQDAGFRMQDETVAAIGDRGNVATAVPSYGSHGSAVASVSAAAANTVHFYVCNHRGDTVMVVGESGAVEAHWQYDAFGNVTAQSGSFAPTHTFSTKEHLPGANLYAYAYRVYDPIAGRWTQRDPIDYQDSVNLYQYCGNNGVNLTDADGRQNYLTQTDPDYAYNWALTDREWRFAGNEVNRRMAMMVWAAASVALGAGVVAAYGPAAIAYVNGLLTGHYRYLVDRGGEITTVLGSRADCAKYVGQYGYNVLDPAKNVSVLGNARFIVEAVNRGNNFLFVTDPAKHTMLMKTITEATGKLTTSRYLWLEIPMLQRRLIATPPQ